MITGFDELHGKVELHGRGQKGSELRQPVTSRLKFHVQVVVGVFVHNCSRQTSAPFMTGILTTFILPTQSISEAEQNE